MSNKHKLYMQRDRRRDQRDRLRRLEQENSQLRQENAALRLKMDRLAASAAGTVATLEDAASDQIDLLAENERFKRAFARDAPAEIVCELIQRNRALKHALALAVPVEALRVHRVPEEALPDELPDRWVKQRTGRITLVTYRFYLTHGPGLQTLTLAGGHGVYPGSYEEAERELRIEVDQLIRRAPLPNEFASAGIYIPDDVLVTISRTLSTYYHDPDLNNQFSSQIRQLYDQYRDQIEASPDFTESQVYDRFRKTFTRSFEKRAKRARASESYA